MPTPRKTLHEFAVRDRTFLARRHAYLLEQEPLLEGPRLQRLQLAYRAEPGRLERRAIAVRFEREVGRTPENPLDERFAHLPVELLPLGRQRKTLTDRILEGSFHTGRHAWLLAQDTLSEACPLPGRNAAWEWQWLCILQRIYRVALKARSGNEKQSVKFRRQVVHDFAAATRELFSKQQATSSRGDRRSRHHPPRLIA